jgi:hypothetical protein
VKKDIKNILSASHQNVTSSFAGFTHYGLYNQDTSPAQIFLQGYINDIAEKTPEQHVENNHHVSSSKSKTNMTRRSAVTNL